MNPYESPDPIYEKRIEAKASILFLLRILSYVFFSAIIGTALGMAFYKYMDAVLEKIF